MIISSENDRHIWIRDINAAASMNISASPATIDDSSSFSAELLHKIDQAFSEGKDETKTPFESKSNVTADNNGNNNNGSIKHLQVRTNTMAHVCWHRNCSLGRYEYEKAFAVSLPCFLC